MSSHRLLLPSPWQFNWSGLFFLAHLFTSEKHLLRGAAVVMGRWWRGWCRNNLSLKIYVQSKSKSSDAFISGQCNSVSMATSPWVLRIAALHLNLGFLFLWYRNQNTVWVINQANVMPNMKRNCFGWQHHAVLRRISPEIWKSTRRRYCTRKCLPEQVIQQRKELNEIFMKLVY